MKFLVEICLGTRNNQISGAIRKPCIISDMENTKLVAYGLQTIISCSLGCYAYSLLGFANRSSMQAKI